MPGIFDKPWTLLGAAVLVLFGMLTFRSIFPEKRRWWQLPVPLLLAFAAFSVDMLVQTDLEKINSVINTALKAVQQRDYNAIEAAIADNYSDSYHGTKLQLMAYCRKELQRSLIKKIKKTGLLPDISDSNAKAILFATVIFDENSYISQNYKSFLLVKARLSLQKQTDKRWLINRIEILEIDRLPRSWKEIRQ
jgi:hypothetical protein